MVHPANCCSRSWICRIYYYYYRHYSQYNSSNVKRRKISSRITLFIPTYKRRLCTRRTAWIVDMSCTPQLRLQMLPFKWLRILNIRCTLSHRPVTWIFVDGILQKQWHYASAWGNGWRSAQGGCYLAGTAASGTFTLNVSVHPEQAIADALATFALRKVRVSGRVLRRKGEASVLTIITGCPPSVQAEVPFQHQLCIPDSELIKKEDTERTWGRNMLRTVKINQRKCSPIQPLNLHFRGTVI